MDEIGGNTSDLTLTIIIYRVSVPVPQTSDKRPSVRCRVPERVRHACGSNGPCNRTILELKQMLRLQRRVRPEIMRSFVEGGMDKVTAIVSEGDAHEGSVTIPSTVHGEVACNNCVGQDGGNFYLARPDSEFVVHVAHLLPHF